jgi:hypothetical protein
MTLDEQIDAVFQRAQFLMEDKRNESSVQQTDTDYDSSSPFDSKMYEGQDATEIDMYATDFETFINSSEEN